MLISRTRFMYGIIFFVIIFAVFQFRYLWSSDTQSWSTRASKMLVNISSDCLCIDISTGSSHDFCYTLPYDQLSHGRRFSCDWLPILKKLTLLNAQGWTVKTSDIKESAAFITSASQSHFDQVLVLIRSIQMYLMNQRIVFYDLGLNNKSANFIRSLCEVDYRRFQFEKYPSYVKNLYEFRWKPLIIAEALAEFNSIWYMDSSIRLESGNFSALYDKLNCKYRVRNFRLPKIGLCEKSPYLLHSFTGHGIYPVTHPNLYEYFPTNLTLLKDSKCGMYEAGLAIAVKTSFVQNLLKWYVLCALERGCMGPRGAIGSCSFNAVDRYTKFAHCHRFDQSVINLLLAHSYNYNSSYWSSDTKGFFTIQRDGKLSLEDFNQLRYCQGNQSV